MPASLKKRIFGKTIGFDGSQNDVFAALVKELSLYPTVDSDDLDFTVVFREAKEIGRPRALTGEPLELNSRYGFCSVTFALNESGHLETIYFDLRPQSAFARVIEKWLRYDYASATQRIGEIFSELVLVPAVFFDSNQFLLHTAAVCAPGDDQAVLIGGLGGGGKTSLELELCTKKGYRFVADDIAVVSTAGSVFPNLCYPKIYGYNVEGKPELRRQLFEDRGLIDKMHWNMRMRLFGPAGVRRRCSCASLFKEHAVGPLAIGAYYLIVRSSAVRKVAVEPLDGKEAAVLSAKVMEAEYSTFFNHVIRHEYNSDMLSTEPVIRKAQVLEQWHLSAAAVFEKVPTYRLVAPKQMAHQQYVSEASALIKQ